MAGCLGLCGGGPVSFTSGIRAACPGEGAALGREGVSVLGDRPAAPPSVRTDNLVLNTGSGLFTDPALRPAAREAVDGSALVDSVFGVAAAPGRPTSASALPAAPRPRPPRRPKAKGKVLRLADYTNRAELPEAAGVVQQAKVRLVHWSHWFGIVFELARPGP